MRLHSRKKAYWIARRWPVSFDWCVAITPEGYRDAIRTLKADSKTRVPVDSIACVTLLDDGRTQTAIVYFDVTADSDCNAVELIGLIAHEATHVKQYIVELMDEGRLGIEWEAYTMQYLIQELTKSLKLQNGRLEFNVKAQAQ
jgi:hypothetical protein